LGVDFTSGSASAQRSRQSRSGREKANRAERRASPPPHPQKKREEDGYLHGVLVVNGVAPRHSRSKVGEQRQSPPGEDAAATHTSSPPPLVFHVARGRRRAQRGRKEKQQQAPLIKAEDFTDGESACGAFPLPT
jgi:hypothetical protein